ncbi:MAG: prolyl oligopeptidase family serine peptidase [Verrucomicrobiaceae bacterium]|nr:prolyl oligopeptidase family serine peptidase [Verrucomicrobiaceae bacterium]
MKSFRLFLITLTFACEEMPTFGASPDAPPPPNPAVDAGEKWPARRKQIEKEWLKLLGPFPTSKPPLDFQILSTETVPASPDDPSYPTRAGSITRHKIKFRSEAGAGGGTLSDIWIYGWLLVPKSASEAHEKNGAKCPAVICLHSTTYGAGKSSAAGLAGRFASDSKIGFVGRPDLVGKDSRYNNGMPDPSDPQALHDYHASGRASGMLLAKQGFVTLSIDLLGDGERIEPGQRPNDTRQFYKQRYPDPLADSAWSIIGKAVWDVMRSVDCLQSLAYINPEGIGCTGWSYGGHVTLFAAALDQRIAAAVPNGGVLDWDRPKYPEGYQGKPKANAWCRQPATMEPWTANGAEAPSSGAESLRRWGFLQNSGPVLYIPKFYPYTLPENRTLPLPVGFESLMMMIAPRPLLILSSEIEFRQHDILPKCMETMKVYAQWQDVKNSGLPSPLAARRIRRGHAETQSYYTQNNGYSPKGIDSYLSSLRAGDCFSWFSFPGGHSYPFSAQMVTTGWFSRWLGLHPAAPVPPSPNIPADKALHIGPLR